MWVAVGIGTNTLAYSTDGLNWIGLGISIFAYQGRGVAWNGTMWVAVGHGLNTIAYSYDGINWTGLGNTICNKGISVTWNGTMWLVGCISATWNGTGWSVNTTNPCFVWSNDGINWYQTTNSLFTLWTWRTMWNGSMWVATGSNIGSTGNTIAYSYDGKTWIPATTGGTIFTFATAIVWNGTMWIVGGNSTTGFCIATSIDGINWYQTTSSNIIGNVYDIAWNGKMFVAVGETTNTIAYSYDGFNWTGVQNSLTIFTRSDKVYWNGTMWIAVGTFGATGVDMANVISGSNTKNAIVYSYDGINWTGAPTSTGIFSSYGFGIAYNNKRANTITFPRKLMVAGGASSTNPLSYSYDGKTWTSANSTNIFSVSTRGVAYNGKMWVAVGQGSTNTMAWSNDGINWTGLGISIFTTFGLAIAWNGTMWIAGGSCMNFPSGQSPIQVGIPSNTIAYSYNGKDWFGLGTSAFIYQANGFAWNGLLWVATGFDSGSTLAWSTNGIDWNRTDASIFSGIGYGVAWNGIMFVATGYAINSIAYSYDGKKWYGVSNSNSNGISTNTTSIFSTTGYGVAWNGIMWVATGYSNNSLAYSYDGINWVGLGTSINGCYPILWNGNMWIVAGNSIISYSYDGKTWNNSIQSTQFTSGFTLACNNNLCDISINQPIYTPNSTSFAGSISYPGNISLSNYNTQATQNLEIVSDSYYNTGYTNMSVSISNIF
jgi:hypothetical protein